MKVERAIHKNYPAILLPFIQSSDQRMILKSQGEAWLQLHSKDNLLDVLSLPFFWRMAKIQMAAGSCYSQVRKQQYLLKWANNFYVGVPDQNYMQVHPYMLNTGETILTTNPISLKSSTYCNVSLNAQNQSRLNVMGINKNYEKIQNSFYLSQVLSPFSNLVINQRQNKLNYVSLISGEGNKELIYYDVENFSTCSRIPLSYDEMHDQMKCLLVGNGQTNLAAVYSKNSLAIIDSRVQGIVSLHPLSSCQTAFSCSPYSIYYSYSNYLYQYQLRKGLNIRNPTLTHRSQISNAEIVGQNLLKIEDNSSSSIYLYTGKQF